ncbi:MAG: glucose-1-phosphate thymidylyltransferase [Firmicutes bacterium]|nr:glucose-1-phosphate thymidylyltransferase [Bacillota bacterium]
MKALILSGGAGTRLRPLTFTNAKQLLPLANKPILFHIIEKLVKAGLRDVGIIVGDTREEVEKTVGNGDRWDVKIRYIHQPAPLGLAHAVKTASGFIGDNDFLMVLGDNVFSMELDALIKNFHSDRANSSLLLHRVDNPSQYGVAVVENAHIKRLVEKPREFISDLIITGVYVFDKSIFEAIDSIPPSPRGELEITDAIQKQLETGGRVTYGIIQGWWKDTGSLRDILEANRLILDEIDCDNKTLPKGDSEITGKILAGKNVVVKNSTIMGPVAIADDTMITNSFIGPYASIGRSARLNDCEVDNCIILENTRIDSIPRRISGSLIGRNVQIVSTRKRPHSNTFLVGDNSEIYL